MQDPQHNPGVATPAEVKEAQAKLMAQVLADWYKITGTDNKPNACTGSIDLHGFDPQR
jgi:hypothetical protein